MYKKEKSYNNRQKNRNSTGNRMEQNINFYLGLQQITNLMGDLDKDKHVMAKQG